MTAVVTRNRAWIAIRSGLLAGGIVVLLCGCGGPVTEPEAELRGWLQRGVAAAEEKQRRALVGMISAAYADSRGNSRDDIDKLLRVYFMRMDRVELLTSIDEIRVIGDSAAELVITAGMAGTHDGVLGFSADAYRFELELLKDGNNWALVSARWGELGKELR